MKKLLSRIYSRDFLYKFLFFGLLISSIGYLVPSFNKQYKGEYYSFKNLPSLSDKTYTDLVVDTLKTGDIYKYKVEALSGVSDRKDLNTLISQDQKTLEKRVESYLGDDFEVELKEESGKAIFNIYTQDNIEGISEILTRNNSDFAISIIDRNAPIPTQAPAAEGEIPAPVDQPTIDLALSRSDFGFADIIATQAQTGNVEFQIKLPIGLIGPDKLNIINNNAFEPLTVSVGGKPYTAEFLDTNSQTFETQSRELTIKGITSVSDARALKAFLNTSKFNFGYKLSSVELIKSKNGLLKLLSLVTVAILAAALINYFTLRNLSVKKLLKILAYSVIGIGSAKLFGLEITDGFILILTSAILLTLFSTKWIYYFGLAAIILTMKLFGYLYFIRLSWTQILLLAVITFAIYSTNNIKNLAKKYV